MKRRYSLVLVLFITLFLLFQGQSLAAEMDLTGTWEGQLNGIRIVFHIEMEDGSYVATMDSPDQGALGIPVSGVTFEGGKVKLVIAAIQGSYEATLTSDGQKMAGTWSQSGYNLPMDMERRQDGDKASVNRPQEPQPPYPYQEIEVTYLNEEDDVKLAGTLTVPDGDGPFPAVLLITGSGSQDRDETLLGHKPFKVIADFLTRKGIAVLRADDRGVGGSTGNPATVTTADLARDALAGVAFLKTRLEIAREEIGLIGHSEGGMIAPMVAVESEDVAFIILLAGPGLPGDEVIMYQVEAIARTGEITEAALEQSLTEQRKILDIVINVKDDQEAARKIRTILEDAVNNMSESDREAVINAYGSLDNYYQQTVNSLLLPWYRFFISYDPRPTLSRVKCPVLAINGSKDLQVAAEPNLTAIKEALQEAGNDQVTVKELPGLNHLFQHSETG
ncbi:MAG: alpha/beta hydrolase, partial [Halanaerobium sp.]|nr:alpha/beta hydrolase [Halanaerobium sp.]